MDTSSLAFESVADLAIRLREGSINSTSLVKQLLDRISRLDGKLHSFIAVMPERALAAARAADTTLKAGQDLGPLHGWSRLASGFPDLLTAWINQRMK